MLDGVLRGFHYHIRILLWQVSWCISCLVGRAAYVKTISGKTDNTRKKIYFPRFYRQDFQSVGNI